jgi:hypothetical protein
MDAVFGPGGSCPRLSKAICLPSTSLYLSFSGDHVVLAVVVGGEHRQSRAKRAAATAAAPCPASADRALLPLCG